ncbi:hypothetical protein BSK52_07600 [Paenibacillus odorifer]|uniref:LHH domain-containing protein n=2 Tax=Paenibacillus odorifer TaxID=189426 RepID=A0A1R0Y5V4_9BACL|nr:hypothetical protein BSK52_07600 [Paenibacillus odorifer]
MENLALGNKEAAEVKRPGADTDIDVRLIDVEKLDRPLYESELNQDKGALSEAIEPVPRPEWTEEEKRQCQLETGWPDTIIDSVRSDEESKIYIDAGLKVSEIGGKPCLERSDIVGDQKDAMGQTNKERMARGLAPLTPDGKTVELHHIGQKADSPLAELTMEQHRGKGNDTILHDKKIESEIDRIAFNAEKAEHWKRRAEAYN